MNIGATKKFDAYEKSKDIKTVEIYTGSAYGHPGVIADVHFGNGKVSRAKDFANEIYNDPADARAVADREAYRMAAEAKKKGVPVIMHTTGIDRKQQQERNAYRSNIPASALRPAPRELNGWLVFAAAIAIIVLVALSPLIVSELLLFMVTH